MLSIHRRSRPSHRHQAGLWTEALESRRLLAVTPISVLSSLPLPGLATGYGIGATAPSPTNVVSVAPASAPSPMLPSATGPSTTLSPLMNDAETANAAASEVARPTPGTSDRISSSVVETPGNEIVFSVRSPREVEVIPGPEIQAVPPAPVPAPAPARTPAEPVEAPAPVPKPVPEAASEAVTLETWDAAIDLIATDPIEASSASPTPHAGSAMAAGLLVAAWGGWKYGSKPNGRARRRPVTIGGPSA